MVEYRLSRQAESDPAGIYRYTESTFGRYAADAYYAGLKRTFELLADFPRIGMSADDVVAGFRRFRFQSHRIFYTEEADYVFIRALIHSRMSLRRDLFE